MPSIVVVVKREDTSKEWFYVVPETWHKFFTQEEIDEILIPHNKNMFNAPGHLKCLNTVVDEKTFVSIHTYDTMENCLNAYRYRYANDDKVISKIRANLIERKKRELGIFDYKVNIRIID